MAEKDIDAAKIKGTAFLKFASAFLMVGAIAGFLFGILALVFGVAGLVGLADSASSVDKKILVSGITFVVFGAAFMVVGTIYILVANAGLRAGRSPRKYRGAFVGGVLGTLVGAAVLVGGLYVVFTTDVQDEIVLVSSLLAFLLPLLYLFSVNVVRTSVRAEVIGKKALAQAARLEKDDGTQAAVPAPVPSSVNAAVPPVEESPSAYTRAEHIPAEGTPSSERDFIIDTGDVYGKAVDNGASGSETDSNASADKGVADRRGTAGESVHGGFIPFDTQDTPAVSNEAED